MQKYMFFAILFAPLLFFPFYAGAVSDKPVAITFDDGPSAETTPKILEILAKFEAKTTFFLTGVNVERYPRITRAIFEQGHEIGNHTYCHFDLPKADSSTLEWQILAAQNAIERITGFSPRIFRPPYSRINETVRRALRTKGLKVVMWDVSPEDYLKSSPGEIAKRVLSAIRPGSIVVMHDYRSDTVIALPAILEGLKEKNLRPVTVSNLEKE